MRRLIAALALAGLLMGLMPSSTLAFETDGRRFGLNSHVTYCFVDGDFTWNQEENLRIAIEHVDQQSSGIFLDKVPNDWTCTIQVDRMNLGGTPMRANYLVNDIDVDTETSFYWPTSPSSCVNEANDQCWPAAYTSMMHEVLHLLGLDHVAGSCSAGWPSGYIISACNTGGRNVMYSQAADGYFRYLSSDDIDGIEFLYGP